jgi:hypothetical protein
MKKTILLNLIILMCIAFSSNAQQINHLEAERAAQAWVTHNPGYELNTTNLLTGDQGDLLGYIYTLSPTGYLVLTTNRSLPPVIAYSKSSVFSTKEEKYNPLYDMLVLDIRSRMDHLDLIPENRREINRSLWDKLLEDRMAERLFQQWPPEGTTSTGGWLETNWTQSHPYNMFCPMDNITGQRSVAGCPSIAISMIINYQRNLNSTLFSDDDDYHHSYAGRQYWIDDDAMGWDFPNFPLLNEFFSSIEIKYQNTTPLNQDEISALIFGCGVAAQQVYTSQVSGTFGVGQAYDALLRFGFQEAALIYDSDTSFYTQMSNNIKTAMPVLLAVLSNTGQGGHNLVTDGYNTDDYFHLNFGWGGSYNGWYLLPEEIPYNLTIIEGAVVDIGDAYVAINEPGFKNQLEVSIYPNPVSDKMYITCSDLKTHEGTVAILSNDGKEVLRKEMKKGNEIIVLDLDNLETGIYLCTITIGKRSSSKQVFKD